MSPWRGAARGCFVLGLRSRSPRQPGAGRAGWVLALTRFPLCFTTLPGSSCSVRHSISMPAMR